MIRKEIEPLKAVIQDKERHDSVVAVTTMKKKVLHHMIIKKLELVKASLYAYGNANMIVLMVLHLTRGCHCISMILFDDYDSSSSKKNKFFCSSFMLIVPISFTSLGLWCPSICKLLSLLDSPTKFSEVFGTRLITCNISVSLVPSQ